MVAGQRQAPNRLEVARKLVEPAADKRVLEEQLAVVVQRNRVPQLVARKLEVVAELVAERRLAVVVGPDTMVELVGPEPIVEERTMVGPELAVV